VLSVQISKLSERWERAQGAADAALQQLQAIEREGGDASSLMMMFDQASGTADDIADRIASLRAISLEEAAAKFRILLRRCGDGHGGFDSPEPIFAYLGDLEQLAAQRRCAA